MVYELRKNPRRIKRLTKSNYVQLKFDFVRDRHGDLLELKFMQSCWVSLQRIGN